MLYFFILATPFNLDLTFGKQFMNFKLSLVYTALFAGVSVSFVANVNAKEHSTNEHTLEGIEVITKIKLKQNGTKKPSK